MGVRLGLVAVVSLYVGLGIAYAVTTPLWQVPDEPAHYNYVAHLAVGEGLPILRQGDYNEEYLRALTTAKFPPTMSVAGLRYEYHQPPLYYVLLTPFYLATSSLYVSQQVIVLRLFSLLLGIPLLLFSYGVAHLLLPGRPLLALGVPGFIALLPQHLAMAASVNNDLAAETVLAAILWVLVRLMAAQKAGGGEENPTPSLWALLGLGALLGVALLTKSTTYIALGLIPLGLFWATCGGLPWGQRLGRALRQMGVVFGVALLISGWWFGRNLAVYGPTDPLGQARHDQVVAGQPRWEALDLTTLEALGRVAFRSFWVQVGWMAVPADERTYTVLWVFALLIFLGLALFLGRNLLQRQRLSCVPWRPLLLLGATFLGVLAAMAAYNLRFMQPQGRYLFPALVPLALLVVLGLSEVSPPRYTPLLFLGAFALLAYLNLLTLTVLVPLLK